MQEKFILLTFAPMNNTAKIWAIAALSLGTSMQIGAKPLHPLVINLHDNNISLSDTTQVVDLDEVVVVSQPKEVMRLRQQPLSSSVFTTKELADLGVDNISGLSAHVPSFVMPDYGSRLTSSLYIRGIGSRIGSSAVGIYVDGIPLVNKSAFNMHLYQLDRIDILRGPQGTLYGMNNEGGLLRMFTREPTSPLVFPLTLVARQKPPIISTLATRWHLPLRPSITVATDIFAMLIAMSDPMTVRRQEGEFA